MHTCSAQSHAPCPQTVPHISPTCSKIAPISSKHTTVHSHIHSFSIPEQYTPQTLLTPHLKPLHTHVISPAPAPRLYRQLDRLLRDPQSYRPLHSIVSCYHPVLCLTLIQCHGTCVLACHTHQVTPLLAAPYRGCTYPFAKATACGSISLPASTFYHTETMPRITPRFFPLQEKGPPYCTMVLPNFSLLFLLIVLVLGPQSAVFRGYSRQCTQKSFPVALGVHMGCPGSNPAWSHAKKTPSPLCYPSSPLLIFEVGRTPVGALH